MKNKTVSQNYFLSHWGGGEGVRRYPLKDWGIVLEFSPVEACQPGALYQLFYRDLNSRNYSDKLLVGWAG
jgi:hypothetical protein